MFWIVARLWEVVALEIGLLIKVNQFFLKWRVLLFCSDPVLGQLTRQIRLGTRYVYRSLLFAYPPVKKMPVYNMSTQEWCCMCYQVCHVTVDCRAASDAESWLLMLSVPSPLPRR